MDRNTAAFLDTKAFTVRVMFQQALAKIKMLDPVPKPNLGYPKKAEESVPFRPEEKSYTYVSNIPLSEGDTVVVPYSQSPDKTRLSVAVVVGVDTTVEIQPNSDLEYLWVVSKVDLTAYNALLSRNTEVMAVVNAAYTQNLRRSFSQQVLSGLSPEEQGRVAALLN